MYGLMRAEKQSGSNGGVSGRDDESERNWSEGQVVGRWLDILSPFIIPRVCYNSNLVKLACNGTGSFYLAF